MIIMWATKPQIHSSMTLPSNIESLQVIISTTPPSAKHIIHATHPTSMSSATWMSSMAHMAPHIYFSCSWTWNTWCGPHSTWLFLYSPHTISPSQTHQVCHRAATPSHCNTFGPESHNTSCARSQLDSASGGGLTSLFIWSKLIITWFSLCAMLCKSVSSLQLAHKSKCWGFSLLAISNQAGGKGSFKLSSNHACRFLMQPLLGNILAALCKDHQC